MPQRERTTAIRSTRQRAALEEVLKSVEGFRTAQELYDEMRKRGGGVGLTTVYRNLQSFADLGAVDVLRNADGESIYRLCATNEHHHHLVCRDCGSSVEIGSNEVERWAKLTAEKHGFTSVTHTAELYGICRPCSKA